MSKPFKVSVEDRGDGAFTLRTDREPESFEEKLLFVASMGVALRVHKGEKDREAIRPEVLAIAVREAEGAARDEYDHETLAAMCRRAVDAALDEAGL
jgi:hypothetical protein